MTRMISILFFPDWHKFWKIFKRSSVPTLTVRTNRLWRKSPRMYPRCVSYGKKYATILRKPCQVGSIKLAQNVFQNGSHTSLGSEVCERFDTGDVGVRGELAWQQVPDLLGDALVESKSFLDSWWFSCASSKQPSSQSKTLLTLVVMSLGVGKRLLG